MSKTVDFRRARAPVQRSGIAGAARLVVLTEEQARSLIAEEIQAHLAGHEHERVNTPAKAYLTNREACEYLGLSRSTLARLRGDGTLRYSKLGANVFYALADIEALLASRADRTD